jgi:SEC-C motif-containing protein
MNIQPCPCQSGQDYAACCGLLHQHKQTAKTAEQLMRSRYSAFVMQQIGYLQATLHASQRQPDDAVTLQQTMESTKWLGLSIVESIETGDEAEVEFIAFYAGQPIGQLHERSRFSRQHDQWFYVDGKFLPSIKLARNDNCFCGSGKKLKRCHGKS